MQQRCTELAGSHFRLVADARRCRGALQRRSWGWQLLAGPRAIEVETFIANPSDSSKPSALEMLRLAIDRASTALIVDRDRPLMRAKASCVSPISVRLVRTASPIS